jgi:hypothetical protein
VGAVRVGLGEPPVRLELTGPAGGAWTLGGDPRAATVVADPVDYLRALAGRNPEPALAGGEPAALDALARARVVF